MGVSIHRESSNVGTSIEMIENYYGHLRNRDPNVVSEITKTFVHRQAQFQDRLFALNFDDRK